VGLWRTTTTREVIIRETTVEEREDDGLPAVVTAASRTTGTDIVPATVDIVACPPPLRSVIQLRAAQIYRT